MAEEGQNGSSLPQKRRKVDSFGLPHEQSSSGTSLGGYFVDNLVVLNLLEVCKRIGF